MSAPDNAVQAARGRLETWAERHPPVVVSPCGVGPNPHDLRTILAALTTAERDRDAAIKSASDGWRAAGEAKGKLEVSETAGVVEGWRQRAEAAERERDENAQLWSAAEDRLLTLRAHYDELQLLCAQAQRRAEEAERLAEKRLEELRPENIRGHALACDHLAIPIRPGTLVTWTDLETGEVLGRGKLERRHTPVLAFDRSALTAAAEGTGDQHD